MSRKKGGDLVYSGIYSNHLNGGGSGGSFQGNTVIQTQALTENMYIRVLTELCCNRFEWKGLPDSIDVRTMELTLFWRALSVFYFDNDVDKYLALRASGAGAIDMYDTPLSYQVTAPGINKHLKQDDCVAIWANYLRIPDLDIVRLYASKLAKVDRTIDQCIENLRYTKVITAPENERHSWTQVLRQHYEGQPVIFGSQALDMSNVQAFDVGAHHETLPKLLLGKSKLWNECMTLLGINNANQDKAERLIADEVSANDEQIHATRAIALNARQQACDEMKIKFGLDVSVDFSVSEKSTEIGGNIEIGNGEE